MTPTPLIDIQNLVFDYPGHRALRGLNAQIEPHTVTALVGPNGAGKTTLLRCIAALDTPVAGTIHVAGLDVNESPRDAHQRMGYLSDTFGVYRNLSVLQALTHAARARGLTPQAATSAARSTAEKVQLTDKLEAKAGTLSRGQRQRLAIGQAIVHTPQILLLDEPANGLDPEARSSLARVFTDLRQEGMTLIVSSHILSELDEYSTHMLALDQGLVLAHRPLTSPVDATTDDSGTSPAWKRMRFVDDAMPPTALPLLLEYPGVAEVNIDQSYVVFKIDGGRHALAALMTHLVSAGHVPIEVRPHTVNLQDSYLQSLEANRNTRQETQA